MGKSLTLGWLVASCAPSDPFIRANWATKDIETGIEGAINRVACPLNVTGGVGRKRAISENRAFVSLKFEIAALLNLFTEVHRCFGVT